MPAHIADNLAVHMSLQQETMLRELNGLKAELREQKRRSNARIKQLEKEVETLKSEQLVTRTHFRLTPIQFFVTDFLSKKINEKIWNSPPFYTHPQGYKLCLDIHTNGSDDGEGTHISVYLHLMRGEFDNQLK